MTALQFYVAREPASLCEGTILVDVNGVTEDLVSLFGIKVT